MWSVCVLAGFPAGAQAAVLEIQTDGSVTVYDGPAQIAGEFVKPIVTPAWATHTAVTANDMTAHFADAARRAQLSPELIAAVAWTESRFRQPARSSKGSVGVMQLMPATAARLGVNPLDTAENIRGGALYLRAMLQRFGGDLPLALAAYNAGPQAVRRHGGIPPYPETKAYVADVLNQLAAAAGNAEETGQ